MADTPLFSVGGLASGLDTTSIIDGLTKIEQQPLDALRTQQTGFQDPGLADRPAGRRRSTPCRPPPRRCPTTGVVGVKTTSTNTDFTAIADLEDARPGAYTVSVQTLATSAQKRTAGSCPTSRQHRRSRAARSTLTVQGDDLRSDHDHRRREPGRRRRRHPRARRADQRGGAERRHPAVSLDHQPQHRLHRHRRHRPRCRSTRPTTGTQGQALGFTPIHDASNAAVHHRRAAVHASDQHRHRRAARDDAEPQGADQHQGEPDAAPTTARRRR